MKEAIKGWLSSVIERCNDFGKQIGLDYYCFQSVIPENDADVLIIGINPGGSGAFRFKQPDNTLSQGVNLYSVKNPHPDNLKMVGKLSRVFTSDYLKDALESATIMNLYYFNTKDVEMLDKSLNNDVKRFCQAKTREVMDILNPRKIIFLCTQGSELSSVGVTNIHGIGNFMKVGIWKEKEVIALPNPGYYAAYSYSNGFEMGKKLEDYLLK